MLYRQVPKNGDKLSILGYGCMRFPLKDGKIDEPMAEKQMLHALEKGVNYYDTAYPYHNGQSEPFLGKVVERNKIRDKVKLATKLPHWLCADKKAMEAKLDEQLERLRTDRIDYYLLHALNGSVWDAAKDKGILDFLDDALKSGKILNAGFSFHGLSEGFPQIVDDYDWTFCQIQYNYLDTKNQAGTAGLNYAAKKDIAVIIMEPLRGGNLSKTPPPTVAEIWNKAETKRTPAEWSLRWIYDHPEVTVVLSGMNDDAHIDENLAIADKGEPGSLSKLELALVDEAAEEFTRVMLVGCTGCQYCMPCPAGVDIPNSFQHYNSKNVFKDPNAQRVYNFQNSGMISKPSKASLCV